MSSLAFPLHDPLNRETPFLKQILPILKANFNRAFVSITPLTVKHNLEAVSFLKENPFFIVNKNREDSHIGEHLVAAYKNALENTASDEIIHLCSSDRLAYALLNFREAFLNDTNKPQTPLLYIRSEKAWLSHPPLYRAAETLVTNTGQMLLGKKLDFAWCHLAVSSRELQKIIPKLTAKDLVVTAQIVYLLMDIIHTKEVDWLSWEDPFIFDKNAETYKKERNLDPQELEKRMSYVQPQIEYLFKMYQENNR